MKKLIYFYLLTPLSLFSCEKQSTDTDQQISQTNSLEIIDTDMTLPHEGELNGVPPEFDWSEYPRVGWGNNPPSDWSAMIPWGQVYRDSSAIETQNSRIHIRELQAWYLNSDNEWVEWVTSSAITGAYYAEDFENDANTEAQIRQEEAGGISVEFLDGYNFHFWTSGGRISMDPNNIHGVWISVQARLIMDNTSLEDDRNKANFLLGAGGDYWRNLTAEWDNFRSSGDIGIGRMKYLNSEWRSFNMHTLSSEQLREFPPPFSPDR